MSEDTNGRASGRWTATRGSLPSLYNADVQVDPAAMPARQTVTDSSATPRPALRAVQEIHQDRVHMHDPPDWSLDDLPRVSDAGEPVMSLDADVDDRRVFPRRSLDQPMKVTLSGREIEVNGVDISRGGIRCEPLPYWTRLGDPVLVQLPAPHYHALGRVVWVRPSNDAGDARTGGIRFTSPLAYL